jgi:hypothetical protein
MMEWMLGQATPVGSGGLTAMAIAQWMINAAMVVAISYLGLKSRELVELKRDLQEGAAELVDTRIRAMSEQCELKCGALAHPVGQITELNASVRVIMTEIASINKRLERGDAEFDRTAQRREDLMVSVRTEIEAVRESVRDQCATKDDVRRLEQRIETMQSMMTESLRHRDTERNG